MLTRAFGIAGTRGMALGSGGGWGDGYLLLCMGQAPKRQKPDVEVEEVVHTAETVPGLPPDARVYTEIIQSPSSLPGSLGVSQHSAASRDRLKKL